MVTHKFARLTREAPVRLSLRHAGPRPCASAASRRSGRASPACSTAEPYSVQFTSVEHGALGDFDNRKRYVAAVVPGRESKRTRYPLTDCTLPVTIEFRMTIDRGDKRPLVEAERVLGELQRRICESRTLDGLAIDVRETGNHVDLDTSADKAIEGRFFWRCATAMPPTILGLRPEASITD